MQIFYQLPSFPQQEGINSRYLGFDKIYFDKGDVTGIKDLVPSLNGE